MAGLRLGLRLALGRSAPADGDAGGYGPNLVENGTFPGDDTTGWSIGPGSSVTGEKIVVANSTGLARNNSYAIPAGLEEGAPYLVEFEVSDLVSVGIGVSRSVILGGTVYAWPQASVVNGPFSQVIVAGAAETLIVQNRSGDSYALDNFSVRKAP